MFSKKKKKPEISGPINFQHRLHTDFDKREGKFVGLPPQWASLVGNNQVRYFSFSSYMCIHITNQSFTNIVT